MTFYFNHQTRIVSGADTKHQVGQQAKELGMHKAMVVYDPFFKDSHIVKDIISYLAAEGIAAIEFSQVQPNPRDYDCEQGAELARQAEVDGIIGLGGGSALDEAKAIAALVTNGGSCDQWDGVDLKEPMLPGVYLPTTAGTGAEVSFCAVIDDTKRHFKMAFFDAVNFIPTVAILDPTLTTTLPQSATAGPGMDVMTHAVEAYTAKPHNPISDALALSAIRMVKENLPVAFNEPENLQARENMLVASSMASMAFINSNVGAVHALSETIGAEYDLPHGLLNALLITPTMAYNLDANYQRFADIAQALGVSVQGKSVSELAEAGVAEMAKFVKQFNLPNLASFDKFGPAEFSRLAERAMTNDLTADNVKQMTAQAYVEILEQAYQA